MEVKRNWFLQKWEQPKWFAKGGAPKMLSPPNGGRALRHDSHITPF